MYLCQICGTCTARGQPLLRLVIEREVPHLYNQQFRRDGPVTRREIAAEYALCPRCKRRIDRGESFADLLDEFSLVRSQRADNGLPPGPKVDGSKVAPKAEFVQVGEEV